jgi:hypothetical protein
MRVGRGDGSTDDADVRGLRTVRHMRPEVVSVCVNMYVWVWMLEGHAYMYVLSIEKPTKRDTYDLSTIRAA